MHRFTVNIKIIMNNKLRYKRRKTVSFWYRLAHGKDLTPDGNFSSHVLGAITKLKPYILVEIT